MRPSMPYLLRIGVAAMLLLCVVSGAFAQLQQDCTISVLNRTTQVQLGGSFVTTTREMGWEAWKKRSCCFNLDGFTR